MTNTPLKGLGDPSIGLVTSIDDAMEMKRWLSERHDVIAVDTETSGLSPYEKGAELRMVQIGDQNTGWAIPWAQWGGAALEILQAWDGIFAVHNLAFDAKWLKHHAGFVFPWERTHDTMIMHQMLYPGESAALKTATRKLIDPRAADGQDWLDGEMKRNGWTWATIPVTNEAYWNYSALDPIITAALWAELRADQMYPESFDLEMNTLRICNEMEDRGIYIDVDYCMQKEKELEEYVEKAKAWGQQELGISIGSNVQLAKYFVEKLGVQIEKRTPGGAPSMDKDTLALLANSPSPKVAQLAGFIEGVRAADKLRGSYFENFIKDNIGGILHPNIKTMQAKTGRMSITSPALQTLPSNSNIVRNAVIPRDNTEILISSDLDQVEFRIFSHLSQDPNLIQTFREADATGGDPFTEIGKQVYDDPNFVKTDPRRKLIKSTIYGRLFGSGVRKMAETAGVSFETMQAVNKSLDETYPGIRTYQKELEKEIEDRAKSTGECYVTTKVTGRRIPVDTDKVYAGVNYTIQSSAAEVFKTNLTRIDAAGLGEYLVVPVHDEVVLSIPEDIAAEAAITIKECMTTTERWSIPLTGDVSKTMRRWGDKY